MLSAVLATALALTLPVKAQPVKTSVEADAQSQGMTILRSRHHPNVTVSFKENRICETTEGVKSIAGYIHLPPGTLENFGTKQDYPINSFFWFFESRKNASDAPFSIWMNGGPGTSSMTALFQENGPCWVNNDSRTSRLNEWSWNNHANMLYFDQPNQVGFSYDTLNNATVMLDPSQGGLPTYGDAPGPDFQPNSTYFAATVATQNMNFTANTTEIAAQAFWHFAQIFFEEFEQYKPDDNKISIWAESYGGKYGPAFAAILEQQAEKIQKRDFVYADAIPLRVHNLGIINGCVDDDIFLESYPKIVYNNTYNVSFISEERYNSMMTNITAKDGIREKIHKCIAAATAKDPNNLGDVESVNQLCVEAYDSEFQLFDYDLPEGGDLPSQYDLANSDWDPKPEQYSSGFLNDHAVRTAMGVPNNFTGDSDAAYNAFYATGDEPRPGTMDYMAYLLSRGVHVHLVYGDRDIICNWYGGEEASLRINYTNTDDFKSAGYTDLIVNDTYVGGQVRQYGGLSFVRVYQAGHMVPWYQPEASHEIFYRAIYGKDIATGKIDIGKNTTYTTEGPSTCDHIMNDLPKKHEPECYVLAGSTCTNDQWKKIGAGEGAIKDFIWTQ